MLRTCLRLVWNQINLEIIDRAAAGYRDKFAARFILLDELGAFIGAEGKPLPRKNLVLTRSDIGQPKLTR